jgi:hypothetical protein
MDDKEYLIFCDESDTSGAFYSNFYGGVLVGSAQYDRITARLNVVKERLHLHGEVKWSKVSAPYLSKYQELIKIFFQEVRKGHLKVRIMFRQNIHQPVGLTEDQIEGAFFRLYYQFIKHAFGLMHRPAGSPAAKLRLFFDEFPDTKEAAAQFKGYILGLKDNPHIHRAGFKLEMQDIAEFRSHDHVLAQCLDIVLGAMAFRLNNKHKEIPPGLKRRGKRTVAKEKLYKTILTEIHCIRPKLNIGVSTGTGHGHIERWTAPYLHWNFRPSKAEYRGEFSKPKKKSGPTKPT